MSQDSSLNCLSFVVIKPILILEDQEREVQKHASFGEEYGLYVFFINKLSGFSLNIP